MGILNNFHLVILFVICVGCARDDHFSTCPPISAPEEGARAFVRTDESKQIVDVRLNGVDATCSLKDSGDTEMHIKVGLKLKRTLDEGSGADVIAVPMMTATVDNSGNVIGNDQFGYKVGIETEEKLIYPVAEFEAIIPAGARIVLSLVPSN